MVDKHSKIKFGLRRRYSIRWIAIISSILILTVVGIILGMSIVNDFQSTLKMKEGEKILSALKAVAANIDGDRYEALVKSLDDKDPYYEELRQYLLKVKNTTGLRYLFTESYLSDGKTTAYIVDGNETNKEDFSPIGTPVNTDVETIDTEETIAALKNGVEGYTDFYETEEWGTLFSAFEPIRNSKGKVVGVIGADALANNVADMIKSTTYRVSTIIFLGFAVIVLLIALLISRILRPINKIKDYALEVSNGNLAVSLPNAGESNNEIGDIYKAFSLMAANMTNIIRSIKESVGKLLEFNAQLVENAKNSSIAAEDVSSTIVDAANSAVEQERILAEAINDLEKVKQQLDIAMERLNDVFCEMEKGQEMSLTKRGEIDKFGENISLLSTVVGTTQENLNELFDEISNIYTFTETMDKIAAQTNLLSLNAGIEAARAGEAGKGFGVVAHEIQQLSHRATDSARSIKTAADKIHSKAKETIENMGLTVDTVKEGVSISTSMQDYIKYVMTSIENNVNNVSVISRDYANIQNGLDRTLTRFTEISELIKAFSDKMNNIAATSQEQTAMSTELGHSTLILKDITEKLSEEINAFKTE